MTKEDWIDLPFHILLFVVALIVLVSVVFDFGGDDE